jgi:hypothetical protein
MSAPAAGRSRGEGSPADPWLCVPASRRVCPGRNGPRAADLAAGMNVGPMRRRANSPLVLTGYRWVPDVTGIRAKSPLEKQQDRLRRRSCRAQGRYAPVARTASGDPPRGRGWSLRWPAGRPGRAWPEPRFGGSLPELPPNPGAQRQCRRSHRRDDEREARQVRLHSTPPVRSPRRLAGGRAVSLGIRPRKIPGFASPPLDGFALVG